VFLTVFSAEISVQQGAIMAYEIRKLSRILMLLFCGLIWQTGSRAAASAADFRGWMNLEINHLELSPYSRQRVFLPGGVNRLNGLQITSYSLYGGSATVDVFVNGEGKGRMSYPTHSPTQVVNVGEIADSLELRQLGGDTVIVSAIWVDIEASQPGPPEPFPPHHFWGAERLSSHAVDLDDHLEGYASYEEYGRYLLPAPISGLPSSADDNPPG
jgi:hypothetical protein